MWNPVLIWSLKAGLILSLLYLAYIVLFRNNTHFKLKRLLLLTTLLAAIVWPLITVTSSHSAVPTLHAFQQIDATVQAPESITFSTKTEEPAVKSKSFDLSNTLWWIYLAGVALSGLLILVELTRLVYWRLSGVRKPLLGPQVISHRTIQFPFSFLQWIFIPSDTDYSPNEWEIIQRHELTHLQQKHTVDVLFSALLQCVLWYHPAIYLMQKAIRSNHEALADEAVLRNTPLKKYSKILLAMSLQTNPLLLGHSFALISSLSKRIKVMKRKRTKQSTTWAALGSFVVIMILIATQTIAYGQDENAEADSIYWGSHQSTLGISVLSSVNIFEIKVESSDSPFFQNSTTAFVSTFIPLIQDEKCNAIVNKIKETYYKDVPVGKISFRIELSSDKKTYYDELLRTPLNSYKTEYITELSLEDRKRLYQLAKNWLEPKLHLFPDFHIVSEESFLQQKYLIVKSAILKDEYGSKFKNTDVFSTRQVDVPAEPIGGLKQFTNNVALDIIRDQSISIEDLPNAVKFEFVVHRNGMITQLNLKSKIRGDKATQDKVYELMGEINNSLLKKSQLYRWKPAIKDNEPVSSRVTIEIPKTLL